MGTADAVAREAAWLRTSGDGLPALLRTDGGPFDVVQAYMQRTPESSERSLYVLRQRIRVTRFAAIRRMPKYQFSLRIWWPMLDDTGSAETEQAALDDAVDKVLTRITGTLQDKTHGGRFLSVAEGAEELTVTFTEPLRTLTEVGALLADITYSADDIEVPG